MAKRRTIFTAAAACAGVATIGLWPRGRRADAALPVVGAERFTVVHTDAEWRKRLDPAAYQVLRHAGTEPPFTSPLLHEEQSGTFNCAGCALPLFASKTKFDSGTGWPSFWTSLPHAVATSADDGFGMTRTEVHCSRCGGHLGHVFPDGPRPTGLRYCMNGAALKFIAESV